MMPQSQNSGLGGDNPKRVFVSHPAGAHDVAKLVSQKLRALGVEATSDADAPAGAAVRSWLKERIERSDAVITLVTHGAADTSWMQYELGLATGLDRLVIPVVVDNQMAEVPPQLAAHRTFRLDELDQVEKLIDRTAGEQTAPNE